MANNQPAQERGVSDLEIISQQVEDESQCIAPVQLVSFAYRDLPLAALDLSNAIIEMISSNWLKPCCGRRAAVWQVVLLSAGLNCFLVASVVLVVLLLTLELLIDTKLLQFTSAFQFAGIIHWISLVILSIFFTETVFRIVVLGIWDYIENKVEVFDGAVIILSLAPMVASTVANGPSSPWDAISLIITLRIWKVKRIIDGESEALPVTSLMFEIRQLRAHLAQQDLDLAAEREAALEMHHVWDKQSSKFQVVDGSATGVSDDESPDSIVDPRQTQKAATRDDMNNYISQYYSEPSSEMGIPEGASHVITTAAIDVHLPSVLHNASSDLLTVETPAKLERASSSASENSGSASRSIDSTTTQAQTLSSQTLGSSTDCSTTREGSSESYLLERPEIQQHSITEPVVPKDSSVVVQELLSTLSEEKCLTQKGLDPVNLKLPSPPGSTNASPELGHRVNIYNKKNQDNLCVYPTTPVIQIQGNDITLEEKYRFLEPIESSVKRLPES
ncbi:hypothetical protein scyTo_0006743 [Scyliorhinus torazame]|uniref:Ion transport domain-containing protein n=1 Tax=Scyliorhinus torazame TaxID=75743 RepID=A0A401PJR9_SCYTO|nr:hypothetical protein [Scyliorhinus torazame]